MAHNSRRLFQLSGFFKNKIGGLFGKLGLRQKYKESSELITGAGVEDGHADAAAGLPITSGGFDNGGAGTTKSSAGNKQLHECRVVSIPPDEPIQFVQDGVGAEQSEPDYPFTDDDDDDTNDEAVDLDLAEVNSAEVGDGDERPCTSSSSVYVNGVLNRGGADESALQSQDWQVGSSRTKEGNPTDFASLARIHVKSFRRQTKAPDCGTCCKVSKNSSKHLATPKPHKPFKCDMPNCKTRFKLKSSLTVHQRNMHTNPGKKFKCPHCNYASRHSITDVNRHVARRHTMINRTEYEKAQGTTVQSESRASI